MKALSNPAEEFLSWLAVERGRSQNTIASYRRDIAAYEMHLGEQGLPPLGATAGDLERYLARLRASGHGPATVARVVSSLRGLHRFLVDEGYAASDPTADLEPGRIPLRLPKALGEDAVARIIESVSGDDPLSRRDRALLEVLYGTGARVSEAVGLNLADLAELDDSGGLLRLFGKGAKERVVPLGRQAAAALERWVGEGGRDRLSPERWRTRNDAEAVFLNARGSRLSRQGAFAAVRSRAGAVGTPIGPHTLRHSCATHMLAHGAGVRVVQELLGHASVTTTQLYTKVTNEHLRAVYEAAHPRARRTAQAGTDHGSDEGAAAR